MYQALYRKYRPRSFEDVVGQSHITGTLRRQIATGRTSHAYLFVGTRGTGKTTCAKILARALNCRQPKDGDPCNECPSCVGIENGSVLDVVEIDAASNNGVDNIRAIRDEAVFSPASVKKRVYIIDEVHMLSASAFNALLKILEEPPEHLVFILATTEIRKIPATILSRCQRFSFKRIMLADIMSRLKYVASEEGLELTEDAAALLARLADGSMRDALSLLDQCASGSRIDEAAVMSSIGLTGSVDTIALFKHLALGNTPDALDLFNKLYLGGMDPSALLSALLSMCRDMLILKVAPENGSALISGAYGSDALKKLSENISAGALISCSELIQEAMTSMSLVKDKRTAAELALIKLAASLMGTAPTPEIQPVYRQQSGTPVPDSKPAPAAETVVPPAPVYDPAPWEDEAAPTPETAPAEPRPVSIENDPFIPKHVKEAYASGQPAPAKTERMAPPKAETQAAPEGDWWQKILSVAKNFIDPPVFTILSDSAHVAAESDTNSVTIFAKNDFVLLMIDTSDVKSAIKSAADKVFGRPVIIKTSKGLPERPAPAVDKLAELERFGNIKFE